MYGIDPVPRQKVFLEKLLRVLPSRFEPQGRPTNLGGFHFRSLNSNFFSVMKVRPSIKRLCSDCSIVKRQGVLRVICKNPRHKQRQGN